MMNQEDTERFFSKINIPSNPNECWTWTGAKEKRVNFLPYGRFKLKRQMKIAHRVSFEYFNRYTPSRWEFVCHKCDNPSCVNPSHLWIGTPKQNTQDMMNKKRDWKRKQTHCKNGHEFTNDNIYHYKGMRHCRTCRAFHSSKRNKGPR